MKALVVIALIALVGCDGLGRSIVGTRPIVDGGDGDQCEVTPRCRALRTVDPSALTIPPERLAPATFTDCDQDGVDDVVDNCPGVSNQDQADVCVGARSSCERLRAGASDVAYDDLRGCRIDAPLEPRPGFSLHGALLECASLTLSAADTMQPLDLTEARLTRTSLSLESESAWIVDASRAEIHDTFMRLRGGARLRARETIVGDTSVVIEPGAAMGSDPSPGIELTASDVQQSTFYEAPSAWPARVRAERSTVRMTALSVRALDLVGPSMMVADTIDAHELLALGIDLVTTSVRADYAAFAGSHLRDVVFARCADVQMVECMLDDVDMPACEPDRFRLMDTDAVGVNFAGGVSMSGGSLATSVVGGGPATTLHAEHTELEVITICDLGAAAFRGSDLRCVKCEEDAFMQGASVCLRDTIVVERGCPAIELAPECP